MALIKFKLLDEKQSLTLPACNLSLVINSFDINVQSLGSSQTVSVVNYSDVFGEDETLINMNLIQASPLQLLTKSLSS